MRRRFEHRQTGVSRPRFDVARVADRAAETGGFDELRHRGGTHDQRGAGVAQHVSEIAGAVEHVQRDCNRAQSQRREIRVREGVPILAVDRDAVAGTHPGLGEAVRNAARAVVQFAIGDVVERKRGGAIVQRAVEQVEQRAHPARTSSFASATSPARSTLTAVCANGETNARTGAPRMRLARRSACAMLSMPAA